jgi:transposase, IS6 family
MLGFGSFHTANRALKGIEIINIIRKGQIQSVDKGYIFAKVNFIDHLFPIAS